MGRRVNGSGPNVSARRVMVIGSGVGGVVAALRLATAGLDVTVCEAASQPGGKVRDVAVGGQWVGSGPTVFTMRSVFDAIFEAGGSSLDAAVRLTPLDTLARHRWTGGAQLDLFHDVERSADAIGAFAGSAEARGYRTFAARARRIYETLDEPFIRNTRPSAPELMRRIGPRRVASLAGISPFTTLARALEGHFSDPRLRQLFGRYATYCGSSPYLAPATLMLVAHVEREGVWSIEGGMRQLVDALVRLAEAQGATFRYGTAVREIRVAGGAASGVTLVDGEVIEADAVVSNADAGAFAAGLFGPDVARAVSGVAPPQRSLSALTWSLLGETAGAELAHHTVFFSDDYEAEFSSIRAGRPPADPTVYVCASDRSPGRPAPAGPERLFLIVNAPANGDTSPLSATELASCETRTFRRLERCGLSVRRQVGSIVATTPSDFAAKFPGTGGALYGRASHGWMSSFQRPGSRSRIPGLYLAGGSIHPGPGVPMAAMAGTLAADSVLSDLTSTATSRPAATRGGMSTR